MNHDKKFHEFFSTLTLALHNVSALALRDKLMALQKNHLVFNVSWRFAWVFQVFFLHFLILFIQSHHNFLARSTWRLHIFFSPFFTACLMLSILTRGARSTWERMVKSFELSQCESHFHSSQCSQPSAVKLTQSVQNVSLAGDVWKNFSIITFRFVYEPEGRPKTKQGRAENHFNTHPVKMTTASRGDDKFWNS